MAKNKVSPFFPDIVYTYLNNNRITETRRFGNCTLWIGIDELAHFSNNAKVRKIDSEWRCIKWEIFHIELSHFIRYMFTFSLLCFHIL